MKLPNKSILIAIPILIVLFFFLPEYSTYIKVRETSQCEWAFVRYEPSAYELKWMEEIKSNTDATGVCNTIHDNDESYKVLRTSRHLAEGKPVSVSEFEPFSRFVYKSHCKDGTSQVESFSNPGMFFAKLWWERN